MNQPMTRATALAAFVSNRHETSHPDLSGRNLQGTDLSGVSFEEVYANSTNFTAANLEGASFDNADLFEAAFVDANLRAASFIFADCTNADFTGADLRGVNFDYANLTAAAGVLSITGLIATNTVTYPTCDGWMLQIGKHVGVVSEFRAVLEAGVPDARLDGAGFRDDYEARALLDLCDVWAHSRPDLLAAVQKWGTVTD